MKFITKAAPNYRDRRSTQDIMLDVTVALLGIALFAVVYNYRTYGQAYAIRIVLMLLVSVGTSVLTEVLWFALNKRPILANLAVSFPWVTGLILALMCQVNVSYYALAVGAVFAILFAKLLFGGFGFNIFNPAAVGRAIILTSFATAVAVDFATSATPTTTIDTYGWLITDSTIGQTFLNGFGGLSGMFFGTYAGAIGETSSLAIIIAGVYLVWRKAIDWRIPVTYITTLFLLACFVGVVKQTVIWYPLFHILTGGALFGAVFMMTDPVTSPTSMSGRIIFAMGCAIITIIIRLKANLPEGVLFSILLMNMLSPMIENLTDGQQLKHQKINLRSMAVIGTAALVLVFTVSQLITAVDPNAVVIPEVTYKQLPLSDAKLDEYQGEILSKEADGDLTTYLVSMPGFGILYSTDDYYTYSNNEFEIVVNTAELQIVSVKFVTFGDTPKIGDKANNEDLLATYAGMTVTDTAQDADLMSGATYTSMSIAAAVRLVMNDMGY